MTRTGSVTKMGAEMCAMLCPSRSRCASVIEPPPPSAPPRAAFADEEWLLPTWKVVETRGVIFDEHSGHRGWGTASHTCTCSAKWRLVSGEPSSTPQSWMATGEVTHPGYKGAVHECEACGAEWYCIGVVNVE